MIPQRKEYVGYTASMQQVTKDIYTTSVGKEEFYPKRRVWCQTQTKEIFKKKFNRIKSFIAVANLQHNLQIFIILYRTETF